MSQGVSGETRVKWVCGATYLSGTSFSLLIYPAVEFIALVNRATIHYWPGNALIVPMDVFPYELVTGSIAVGNLVHGEACKGDVEGVKRLVRDGADVDAIDGNGFAALVFAAQKDHLEVVRYLVEQGADKEAKDALGNTALMKAVQNAHLEVVRYLVVQGADKDVKNTAGETALILAVLGGHPFTWHLKQSIREESAAVTGILLSGSASLTAVVAFSASALVYSLLTRRNEAIPDGAFKVAHVLLDAGADASCLNNNESTALMLLLLRDDIQEGGICSLARKLLQNGTPPLKSNKDGKSAKSIARVRSFHHIEALVEEYGSKPKRPIIFREEPNADESVWFICHNSVSRNETPFAFGGFGNVYHARWSNSRVVLKEIVIRSDVDMKRFRREVNVWSDNKHPTSCNSTVATTIFHPIRICFKW